MQKYLCLQTYLIEQSILNTITQMDFMSSRDSHAESFVSETSNNSYLISSRKRLLDEAENDLHQFKEQINFKFIRSIANKTYTYPLSEEAFNTLNDEEEFKDLVNVKQYDLHQQGYQNGGFKKQQFKVKGSSTQSKAGKALLQSIREEKNRIEGIRMLINESFRAAGTNSYLTRDSIQTKKSVKISNGQSHRNTRQNKLYNNVIYEQPEQLLMRKKRLLTQPYEKTNSILQKNAGFIIKRK